MKKVRAGLFIVGVVLLFTTLWLWWNRPHTLDMSEYAPADAIVYIEANDLPAVAAALFSTEAWTRTARENNSRITPRRVEWLSTIVRYTGIGTADAVVMARAQIAVAVLDIHAAAEAASEQELAVNIKPRFAAVIETNMSERRARLGLEKILSRIAAQTFSPPQLARESANDVQITIWSGLSGDNRNIFLAVKDSFAVVANDRAALDACLAVYRGERPAIASDTEMRALREQTRASRQQNDRDTVSLNQDNQPLAFGYVSSSGANRLFQILAPLYAVQLSVNPKIQSAAAALLPQLATRFLGGAAWTMRARDNAIEDNYFFKLPPDFAARLRGALQIGDTGNIEIKSEAANLLPADINQTTRYLLPQPDATWRELNLIISSQLDSLTAPLAVALLERSLAPYGIERPREFLPALENEIWTARLDEAGERTILVARIKDRVRLERELRRTFGANARTEQTNFATLILPAARRSGSSGELANASESPAAAAIKNDYLLLGNEQDVRACLIAVSQNRSLASQPKIVPEEINHDKINNDKIKDDNFAIATLTDERETSRAVLRSLLAIENSGAIRRVPENAIAARPFALTRSRVVADGIERRTLSNFGQLGNLITVLAP